MQDTYVSIQHFLFCKKAIISKLNAQKNGSSIKHEKP